MTRQDSAIQKVFYKYTILVNKSNKARKARPNDSADDTGSSNRSDPSGYELNAGDLNNMDSDTATFLYHKLPVRYYKSGSGPPLLILHGWGSNADVMMSLVAGLSDLRTCYIPDLPGFGGTPPPPEPWSVDDYVDFAEQFVTEVAGDRVDILAHSFGGRMALKWCSRRSGLEQAGKVVITGGAGMKPRRTFAFYKRKYTAMLLKAPFLMLPESQSKKALGWLRKTAIWKSLGSSDYRQLDGVMRDTFVRTVSDYLESCLPNISHEVLLIWGKEDHATPLYQGFRMEKGLPNGALVEVAHAGHYVFLDQPDTFLRIVRSFFKQSE